MADIAVADVMPFVPSRESVDAAWERHRALAVGIIDQPKLLLDRKHMEASARAERAWRSLFLRFDAAETGAQRGS